MPNIWMDNIHLAGRQDDAKAKYPALAEQIDQMASQDPSGSQKYLMWMAGQLNKGEPLGEIISLVQTFYERLPRLSQKDINAYASLGDLRGAIEAVPTTKSKSQQEKEVKGEADKIYEDENYTVIYPKTTGASCVYGKGTQWCISATESRNYFTDYSNENNHFYFIINKTLSPNDPHSKIAVVIKDGEITDVFDANDKRIDIDEVTAWPVVGQAVMSASGERKDTPHHLAKNTEDSKTLDELARSSEVDIRISVANNPNTSSETLGLLAKDSLAMVREDVARNPNCSPEILYTLAHDKKDRVRMHVAQNPNTSVEAFLHLGYDPTPWVREYVAANPDAPPELLTYLSSDEYASVRTQVANNRSSPAEALTRLAQDEDVHIRARIAKNPSTPGKTLSNLAFVDSTDEIRRFVADNPSTPSSTLHEMASGENEALRYAVAGNPGASPETLRYISRIDGNAAYMNNTVARNPSTPSDVLDDLSHSYAMTRYYVAQNHHTPESVLRELLSDEDDKVRRNAEENLAARENASPKQASSPNTYSMWYTYNPTKESSMYKSAYSSLSEDVSNVFDLAEEAEDEVRDDDPEAYALIEDIESELHDAVSEVLQVFEDDVPSEKPKQGVRVSDNSDDLADLFMRDVKEARNIPSELDMVMAELLVEGDICPTCERAPLVKTSAAMQCVECGCKFAADVGTVTTRKPKRREIESSDDLELPEPESLEMMFPGPSNSGGEKVTTSSWLSLAADEDDEDVEDDEKDEDSEEDVDQEKSHKDDPHGDEHSPDFGEEDSDEDVKGKDKSDFVPEHSDAQAMEMMYPGPSDSGGVADEMQASPAQVDREMGESPKADVQPTLDQLKYKVEEHNSEALELKREVEDKAQEVADMIDTMYRGLEAHRMPPPSWVPTSMHSIWRTATGIYLDEQSKSPKSPDARQKVAIIYKALMDKYQPEPVGTLASMKAPKDDRRTVIAFDLPGDEAIFQSRNDAALPLSIDQDFGCGCEAEPSMDELSDALHDVFEDEYVMEVPLAMPDESEDLKCKVDHHRMEGEALEKEISQIRQQVDELTELLNAPVESPYNQSIDMMYPGDSYYSSGPTLTLWD